MPIIHHHSRSNNDSAIAAGWYIEWLDQYYRTQTLATPTHWFLILVLCYSRKNPNNNLCRLHSDIFMLTLVSGLALPGWGEPDGWGRALTNPLDSQPKTPLWAWLLRGWREDQDFCTSTKTPKRDESAGVTCPLKLHLSSLGEDSSLWEELPKNSSVLDAFPCNQII